MARNKGNITKVEIIREATHFFLNEGYSNTSPKMICEKLDISTGNLTYYFPSKEHLLAELVSILCDFQWETMQKEADEGYSSIMAICLELTAMATMCEESETAKDFFLATYASPMCLEIIRKNDMERAKDVFKDYCHDWSHEQFAEAEILVSGIEYATLSSVGDEVSLERRIAGAIDSILNIYGIPEESRQSKIKRVLAMDYRSIGRRTLESFKDFAEESSENLLEELLNNKKKKG